MLKDIKVSNIYIVCGHTDMRKSINGLAAIIQEQFDLDLFSDSLFLFCGRRRNRLKALLWEDDGFILLYKVVENGRFRWPNNEDEVRNLTREEFTWLIQKSDKLLCGDFFLLQGFEDFLVFKLCDFRIVLGNALVDYLPLILVGGFLLPKPVTLFIALL